MARMLNTMMSKVESNDLGTFKTYLRRIGYGDPLVTAISLRL
jgi:hypothetical protein